MCPLKKYLSLGIFLIASSTAWSQDSLQNISIARWKVMRLYDMASRAIVCDSLQAAQTMEIGQSRNAIRQANEIIANQDQIIKNDSLIEAEYQSLINTQKEQIKYQKKIRNKWKWTAIGGGIVILLEAVVIGAQVLD